METIPINVRVDEKKLQIIDEYIKEKKLTRAVVFRELINDMAERIIKNKQKEKLIAASRKVSKVSLKENSEFISTLNDGLREE
jgi:uncharacterized protein YktB (UPF0637 family)